MRLSKTLVLGILVSTLIFILANCGVIVPGAVHPDFDEEAESACGHYAAPLVADNLYDAGRVILSNNPENILVEIYTKVEKGWYIEEVQAYAGLDPVPLRAADALPVQPASLGVALALGGVGIECVEARGCTHAPVRQACLRGCFTR